MGCTYLCWVLYKYLNVYICVTKLCPFNWNQKKLILSYSVTVDVIKSYLFKRYYKCLSIIISRSIFYWTIAVFLFTELLFCRLAARIFEFLCVHMCKSFSLHNTLKWMLKQFWMWTLCSHSHSETADPENTLSVTCAWVCVLNRTNS